MDMQEVNGPWKSDLKVVVSTQKLEKSLALKACWEIFERDQTGTKENVPCKQRAAGWSHVL